MQSEETRTSDFNKGKRQGEQSHPAGGGSKVAYTLRIS